MLTRYDPFREMLAIRSTMDRLLDSAMTGTSTLQPATLGLALDVAESENEYVVKASLPGITPEDLEITYTNNTLTIKGEISEEQELEEARYHLRERRYGSFARSITLPAGVDSDKIEANYEAGVLTLRLPKAEEVKPRKIAIKSGNGHKVIEAKASDVTSKK
jgi:HSP20 family protein